MNRLASLLLVLTLSTAFAVDMRGKFGMGAGWTTGQDGFAPSYALTKIGLTQRLVMEPTLNVAVSSLSNAGSDTDYRFDIGVLFAYAVLAHSKTNVYAKAGLGFFQEKGHPWEEYTGILVPLGLGLEHFVSEHFAVDLNARMGTTFTTAEYEGHGDELHVLDLTLGNGEVSAGLVWYY